MEDNYNYIQHTVDLVHQIVQDAVDSQELHFLVAAAFQRKVVDTVEHHMVDNHTVDNLLVAAVHTGQNYYKVDKLEIDLLVDWAEGQLLEDNLIEDEDCRLLAVEYMILVLVEEVE